MDQVLVVKGRVDHKEGETKLIAIEVMPFEATPERKAVHLKLDARTLHEHGRVAVGTRPWGVGLSPDGRLAYTANGRTDDISVVDTQTMKVVRSVKVGTRPWGVAVVR